MDEVRIVKKYELQQQVFLLSMLSNAVNSSTDIGTEAALSAKLWSTMSLMIGLNAESIGDWKIVWGPSVWEVLKFGIVDNVMAVLRKEDARDGIVYAVVIGATNSASPYDWFVEDFDVFTQVDFPGGASGEKFSRATHTGLNKLLGLRSPPDGSSSSPLLAQTTLVQFLASCLDAAQARLIFTGHSLAGALSPTLALYLAQANSPAGAIGPWKEILVLPTAGATPGNAAFAQHYDARFPRQSLGDKNWQSWNAMLWNSLDVVPHAWVPLDLLACPQLYAKVPPPGLPELCLVMVGTLVLGGYHYTRLTNRQLPGHSGPVEGGSWAAYLAEMGRQHVSAYFDFFDVTEWMPPTAPFQPDYHILGAQAEAKVADLLKDKPEALQAGRDFAVRHGVG
jgi:hypothetical protein